MWRSKSRAALIRPGKEAIVPRSQITLEDRSHERLAPEPTTFEDLPLSVLSVIAKAERRGSALHQTNKAGNAEITQGRHIHRFKCNEGGDCTANAFLTMRVKNYADVLSGLEKMCMQRPGSLIIKEVNEVRTPPLKNPTSSFLNTLECVKVIRNNTPYVNVLCAIIASGSLANLLELDLEANDISDPGMASLSNAIARDPLANLKDLNLGHNQIGHAGMESFCSAIASGALAKLKDLNLAYNNIGGDGMKAFASAIAKGALAALQVIMLTENNIGDKGMKALSTAISSGALPKHATVYVGGNPGNKAGVKVACNARGIRCYV